MNSEVLFAILFVIALAVILVIAGLSLGADDVYGWGTKHGDNKPTEKGCDKTHTLKDYAKAVDDMKCKGEPELKEFMDKYHPSMNDKQHKCIEHRADLGDELYENEIMHCYKRNN